MSAKIAVVVGPLLVQGKPTMKGQAEVIIIGGGITGCSIAWHLAKRGCTDVLLLEKGELTSGTTFHSVGLVSQFRTSPALMRLMNYSIGLYDQFKSEGANGIGWHKVGSLRLASSPNRLKALQRHVSRARGLGLDVGTISAKEALDIVPFISPDGIEGAVHIPDDGWMDPNGITLEFARRARELGVTIEKNCQVIGIDTDSLGSVTHVETNKGTVKCSIIINASGQWAPRISAMVGAITPMVPMMHQYVTTRHVPGHELPRQTPVVRDPDNLFYLREEVGGFLVGGFELEPKVWSKGGVPWEFTQQLLPEDWELFEPVMEGALRRVPIIERAEVIKLINGPDAMTPDGHYCLGPVPGVGGFFVAAGMSLNGIAGAGGVGKVMAEWVIDGEPSMDLHEMNIRRFGSNYSDIEFVSEKAREVYHYYYHQHYPADETLWARNQRKSPLYDRLASLGAEFGEKNGWERVNFFSPGKSSRKAADDQKKWGWGRAPYHNLIREECLAARDRVAVFDMSSFGKFEISGPGAIELLQRVACNNVDIPSGSLVYTQFLNSKGGIESDLTICRLSSERFRVITGTSFLSNDLEWVRSQAPTDGSVKLCDVTEDFACIGLWGPRARDVLGQITRDAIDNDTFPYLSARQMTVAGKSAWLQRVSYIGELGWEIYISNDDAVTVWDALLEQGNEHGIRPAGYKALDSLRLEKGYVYWSSDVTPEDNLIEAGLSFCADMSKGDFIGRDALVKLKESGVETRLRTVVLEGNDLPAYGSESVWYKGKIVSRLRSAGHSHITDRSMGYCYLPISLADPGTEVEIELFGELISAKVSLPIHDPKGERLKA